MILKGRSMRVLFIGNTRPYKNLNLLIKTWTKYSKHLEGSHLCVISNSIKAAKYRSINNLELFILLYSHNIT